MGVKCVKWTPMSRPRISENKQFETPYDLPLTTPEQLILRKTIDQAEREGSLEIPVHELVRAVKGTLRGADLSMSPDAIAGSGGTPATDILPASSRPCSPPPIHPINARFLRVAY